MAKKSKKAVKQKREEQRQQAKKKQYRRKLKSYFFYAIIAIIVLGLIGLLFYQSAQPPYIPTTEMAPQTGPGDADVTFLQFGCYTCPFTKQFNQNVVPALMQEYEGRVNFAFKAMPIARNPGSELAAIAAMCANDQDLFWEYSAQLFAAPGSSFTRQQLDSTASNVGMDMDHYEQCMVGGAYRETVRQFASEGRRANVAITPTVFVNGVKLDGIHDISLYRRIINDMLEEAQEN